MRKSSASWVPLLIALGACKSPDAEPDDATEGGRGGGGGQGVPAASAGVAGAGVAGAGVAGVAGKASAGAAGRAGAGGAASGGFGGTAVAGAGHGQGGASQACSNPVATLDVSKITTNQTYDPYFVTGTTADEIRRSINASRSGDYDANTSWYLSWRFGDCNGNGLVVSADITYQYPDWEPPDGADQTLVASWQTYTDALFCHEYGHAKLGLEAANDVHAALSAINARGDCATQQSEGDAAFQRIVADYQAREVKYDADTNHGATMGAVFPPR